MRLFGINLSGSAGGGGVTTVGAFSASSQTNGASISGSTITFGPADGTNPGMVVASGAQTLGATVTWSNPGQVFTASSSYTTTNQQISIKGSLPGTTATTLAVVMVDSDGSGGFMSLANTSNSGVYRYGYRMRVNGTLSNASSAAYSLYFDNRSTCAGKDLASEYGNFGGFFSNNNTNTAGMAVAVRGYGYGSNVNYGGTFAAVTGSGTTPYNIGVEGKSAQAKNASAIGGHFKIYATADSANLINALPAADGAVIADNGNTTAAILWCLDNGSAAFCIRDGGNINTNQTGAFTTLSSPGTVVGRLAIYNTSNTIVGYAPLYASGSFS